jgi:hypothetical protein
MAETNPEGETVAIDPLDVAHTAPFTAIAFPAASTARTIAWVDWPVARLLLGKLTVTAAAAGSLLSLPVAPVTVRIADPLTLPQLAITSVDPPDLPVMMGRPFSSLPVTVAIVESTTTHFTAYAGSELPVAS